MSTVTHTQQVEVPDGPVCANWAYRTYMPPEQNYSCPMLRDTSTHISSAEAQSCGMGVSGGTIASYRCDLFNVGLSFEYGVGPKKCQACRSQVP